jgi:hypothetical protein
VLVLTVGCNANNAFDGNSDGGTDGGNSMGGVFDVEPSALQTLNVTFGQANQNVTYMATYGGQPVNVVWSIDRGEIATLGIGPASMTTVTATGSIGGLANVSAIYQGQTLTRQILVKVSGTQNGINPSSTGEANQIPSGVAALSAGGGVGGVGGEGLGPAVTSQATLNALANPTSNGSAQNLTILYPYNQTVWPRGMLAPLIMWSWTPGNADAIGLTVSTTSGSFTWSGTFGPPTILATTMGPFIRHPIPQDVWDAATNSAGALTQAGKPDGLVVTVTLAKAGVGYGPLTLNFSVAQARLTGTVYYNSYGTQYVKNWTSTDSAGNPIGAAILGVSSGSTAPTLIVGQNSPLNASGIPTSDTGCRVCHVVSTRGRWLLTQSEQGSPNDAQSYLYDLTAANIPASGVAITQTGVFAWAAMLADGSYALTNMINPSSSNPALSTSSSNLWQFGTAPSGSMAPNGLPASVAAGYPSYSPDNTFISYIDVTGSTGNVMGPIIAAAYNAMNQTFSGVTKLATPPSGERYGYPAFLPDNSAIIFEDEIRSSTSDSVMVTRNGARSRLAVINRTGTPTVTLLAQLNGTGYIPKGPNNHGNGTASDPQDSYSEASYDDTTLNYEPTVLPIAVGGYAWVVFTSRRLYGNQLTEVPYLSWPPDYNTKSLAQATVKKIWVAAIDLNAPAGSDPSHPAFYLPAQEILAGNSRGQWVLQACLQNGTSCQTGDQCCNGFCEPNGSGGALECASGSSGGCSMPQEKCSTAADCCDASNQCIAGFCTILG